MKKIYTIALATLFSGSMMAQTDVSKQAVGTKTKVKLSEKLQKVVDDTLGFYEWAAAGTPAIFGINGAQGYVCGTYWTQDTTGAYNPGNSNGAFVGQINYGKYIVEDVLFWVGAKGYPANGGNSNIVCKVFLMDDSTSYSSGGTPIYAGIAPGTQVGGSGSVTVASIDTSSSGNAGFTTVSLSTPATILATDGDWGVLVDWSDCYNNGDTVGLVLSADNPAVTYTDPQNYVFQYYIPNVLDWVRFYDAWQSWANNIPAIWPVVQTAVGIQEEFNNVGFKLYQNYPNPVKNNATITYELKDGGNTSFVILDSQGKEVYNEFGYKTRGKYNINVADLNLSSGLYFYSLSVDGHRLTMKMIIE